MLSVAVMRSRIKSFERSLCLPYRLPCVRQEQYSLCTVFVPQCTSGFLAQHLGCFSMVVNTNPVGSHATCMQYVRSPDPTLLETLNCAYAAMCPVCSSRASPSKLGVPAHLSHTTPPRAHGTTSVPEATSPTPGPPCLSTASTTLHKAGLPC